MLPLIRTHTLRKPRLVARVQSVTHAKASRLIGTSLQHGDTPMSKSIFVLSSAAAIASLTLLSGCQYAASPATAAEIRQTAQSNALLYSNECITEAEVIEAQSAWGDGIVRIGRVHRDDGDYVAAAKDHIQTYYGYDLGSVLFKPTLAAEKQFRNSFDSALSYFVGGNPSYPEDKGFAIKGWSKVRWENAGIINNNCKVAVAMGNYYFTPAKGGEDVKVEYTLAYVKDANEQLKIAVHQSSVPFQSGS